MKVKFNMYDINKIMMKYSFEDCIKSLEEYNQKQEQKIAALQAENNLLKEEFYKDKTIKRLKEEVSNLQSELRLSFDISEKEWEEIKKWKKKHEQEKHEGNNCHGAIGGNYTYVFVPTSIGTIGTIRCSCGEEFTFQNII